MAESGKRGLLSTVWDVMLSPKEAFDWIVKHPMVVAPLLLMVAMDVSVALVWGFKADPRVIVRTQLEKSATWDDMADAQKAELLATQVKLYRPTIAAGAVLASPLIVLLIGSYVLFMSRFFQGSLAGWRQALSVTAFGLLPQLLVQGPLVLATMAAKGDWNVTPDVAFRSSLAGLIHVEAPALQALLGCIDIFGIWALLLLMLGSAALCGKKKLLAGGWPVLAGWVVLSVAKVAWAAF